MNRLTEANVADAPLVGMRDLSEGISGILGHLRQQGLIVRCVGGGRGVHTRYEITRLGAGLIGALRPVTDWAVADFDFVVAATRIRLGLPSLAEPAAAELRQERSATGMAISLLTGLWTNVLMVYVDSAGEGGIGPLRLEDTVNTAIESSTGKDHVARRLQHGTMHTTLNALVAKGLLERVVDPPRVRYLVSAHGRGLMDAWWQVADVWGIAHDAEMFQIMQTTGWFRPPTLD
jgi:DNA-binding HxlR family transcriptional regulator